MDKKEGIPSNEEIIEELTKDLKDSAIKCESDLQKESSSASCDKNSNAESCRIVDEESNEENNSKPPRNENDEIEARLKDRELELSDEDKEKLKKEAEELKKKGNDHFVASEFKEAIEIYTQAILTCPLAYPNDRAILYANRAAAKTKNNDENSAIEDCTKAIELNSTYFKAYLRRAQLYERTDKLDESLADYKKILEFDPAHSEANYAVRRLPPLIEQKNEKLKEEMLGKLKDLGNMILKPFGLSTENFKMEKDPNSGGYSVKFNQNPS
ncbi:tetratricopeptide repeat protein 1 [Chelonus insularis]|uniref:tetratricopeptide repeat protein 1 n=1 Tax=Chelonus insularis TaxID=460826 RepID=UPI00158A2969|nr:tetratricopeptide repeat protein 1 [Chelonus insularis]